jgi:hypothetical protein
MRPHGFPSSTVALTLALLAVVPAAAAQRPFQGIVTGAFFGDDGRPIMQYTQTVKGSHSRMDVQTAGQATSMIMDLAAGTMTSLLHAQRMYLVMDLKAMGMPDAAAPQPPRITATGRTETIAGHTCAHYLLGEDQDLDVCAAQGMGFGLLGAGGPGMGRGTPGLPASYEELARRFRDGFFPLQMESVKAGRRRLVMRVQSVAARPVADSTFRVPAGYTALRLPGAP